MGLSICHDVYLLGCVSWCVLVGLCVMVILRSWVVCHGTVNVSWCVLVGLCVMVWLCVIVCTAWVYIQERSKSSLISRDSSAYFWVRKAPPPNPPTLTVS